MKSEEIKRYENQGLIRRRVVDMPLVKTLVASAENKAKAVKMLRVEDNTAVLIFLGLYESTRQLGDAKWQLIGYESRSHDSSMRLLVETDIKEKLQLQKLDRFRRIRNDANYRGHKVSVEQAKEIIEFWNKCGQDLIKSIDKRIGSR